MTTIRPAAPEDAPAVASLVRELGYPADPAPIRERIESLRKNGDARLLVAIHDGMVAGCIQAHAYVAIEAGLQVEIVGLVVSSQRRRAGTGRALVAEVERWAADCAACAIVVRSNILREESHRFYLSAGFVRSKTQAVYQKPGDVHVA